MVLLGEGETHPPLVLLEPLAIVQDLHEEGVRNDHVASILHAF